MLLTKFTEKIKRVYFFRRTLWNMSIKQFKAKYAGSVLGIFWVAINPFLLMLAISFVFVAVLKTEGKDFSLFVLSGIIPWMFFSGALSEATPSLLAQKNILHQFSLPKEIIPLSVVLSYSLNFIISWLIIFPLFFFRNPASLAMFFLFPLIFILTCIFVCGLSLLFSVTNVIFHDLEHLIGTLLMFWFWVTPIFYSEEMIPLGLRWVLQVNPVSAFVSFYRDIIFYCKIPELSTFLAAAAWACFSLLAGVLVSIRLEPKALKNI
ncbi:MAG: ABC transporter permease [Candidatus Omnitrophica bacterium]|nr:ABC transporter permease [Candidatus Omnitrophota bacterium]MDD5770897.1 ABC transporter permease [Candidatus Omnitrophota bacterium]